MRNMLRCDDDQIEMVTIGEIRCGFGFHLLQSCFGAAPLISSYCIFSLVWARIILKEKLSWKQYLVIAIAAIGIIILGMEG